MTVHPVKVTVPLSSTPRQPVTVSGEPFCVAVMVMGEKSVDTGTPVPLMISSAATEKEGSAVPDEPPEGSVVKTSSVGVPVAEIEPEPPRGELMTKVFV